MLQIGQKFKVTPPKHFKGFAGLTFTVEKITNADTANPLFITSAKYKGISDKVTHCWPLCSLRVHSERGELNIV